MGNSILFPGAGYTNDKSPAMYLTSFLLKLFLYILCASGTMSLSLSKNLMPPTVAFERPIRSNIAPS